jgi:SAM-dependent methyltransferase
MNRAELDANTSADERVVHDLNRHPQLPFADDSFDDVVCCVSIDYLTRPLEVFRDARRVLRPGGRFICTFSNRCFPTKAIQGWLTLGDEQRMDLLGIYFELATGFEVAIKDVRLAAGPSDPLLAVWARIA